MISVVLATFNEAKNLPLCLKSVKGFAEEIVVVDGNSQDDTREIAKRFGGRVISTTNKANFHINKQMAIDAARGDLILQLDADEVVDDELRNFIVKIHQQLAERKFEIHGKEAVGWWVKRKNYFLGKFLTKGGQYPDPVIRLFVKNFAKLPQKDVHEQMVVKGEVGWADGHLIHYSNPTFEDYLRKFNTYTSFKSQQLKTEKIPISTGETLSFIFVKPVKTFVSIFIRHKGFADGISGFVFAVMSSLHHPIAYLKLWESYHES
jgi:glycosyltransferase involved in cell wall biosynthesis